MYDARLITAERIAKRHGKQTVLNDVSINIMRSEKVAIVGRSGSGKTSLLNILATLDHKYEGKCIYRFNYNRIAPYERFLASIVTWLPRMRQQCQLFPYRRNIGFVFQTTFMLENFNLNYNIELSGRAANINGMNVSDIINKLNIGKQANHLSHQVSGGERQRAAIARAIYSQPEIVFADEPTGSLDSHCAEVVMDALVLWCRQINAALVLVTHHAGYAAKYCDRVVGIRTYTNGNLSSKAFDTHEDKYGKRLSKPLMVDENDIFDFIDTNMVPTRIIKAKGHWE